MGVGSVEPASSASVTALGWSIESSTKPMGRLLLRPLSWHSGCRQVRWTAPELSAQTQAPLFLCPASVGRQIWAVRHGRRMFCCTCHRNLISSGDLLTRDSCPGGCPCWYNNLVRAAISGVEVGEAASFLREVFACRVCIALVGASQILVGGSGGTYHDLSCMCVMQERTNRSRVGCCDSCRAVLVRSGSLQLSRSRN